MDITRSIARAAVVGVALTAAAALPSGSAMHGAKAPLHRSANASIAARMADSAHNPSVYASPDAGHVLGPGVPGVHDRPARRVGAVDPARPSVPALRQSPAPPLPSRRPLAERLGEDHEDEARGTASTSGYVSYSAARGWTQ